MSILNFCCVWNNILGSYFAVKCNMKTVFDYLVTSQPQEKYSCFHFWLAQCFFFLLLAPCTCQWQEQQEEQLSRRLLDNKLYWMIVWHETSIYSLVPREFLNSKTPVMICILVVWLRCWDMPICMQYFVFRKWFLHCLWHWSHC